MDEKKKEAALDIAFPFKQWSGKSANFKMGAFIAQKDRDYSERLFTFSQNPSFNYNGDPNTLFSDSNIGLIDSTQRTIKGVTYKRYNFGLVASETVTPAAQYTGDQNVSATYAMLDLPLFNRLRFIGGARFESTDMNVVTQDSTKDTGELKTSDVLPSANLVYSVGQNMNIRAAYSQTLARPTFREIAPYATFDFMGGDTYIGNPHLKRTLIRNMDLRWEWFSRPGEIYAVSAFMKDFTNPIEIVILNTNHELMWKNVDGARVTGVEFEVRKRLDVLNKRLSNFVLGGNLSLVDSRVDISPSELFLIHQTRPDATGSRPFQGQSPYLLNLNISYENSPNGIAASLYYNIFGERLSIVSLGGTPDVYEQPAGILNFSCSWKFVQHLGLSLSARNLLNQRERKIQTFKGRDYIYSEFDRGMTFSLGMKYDL
jgi:TonB-dependent receptor